MIDKIIECIKNHPEGIENNELAQYCGMIPSRLSQYLSNRSDFVFEEGKWFFNSIGLKEENPNLLVIIDLGNVHDCLQKVLPYVESRCCDVRAYADKMSNCFGINPRVTNKHVDVRVASDSHRNAADIEMVWDCATLPVRYTHICVVTRDLGFQTLVTKLKQKGCRVDLVHGWTGLNEIFMDL